jgi:hypothetical protein
LNGGMHRFTWDKTAMISIDSMWLIEAFEDHSGMARYMLNKQTGEVRRISELDDEERDFEDDEDDNESGEAPESEFDSDPWIRIDPLDSSEAFKIMEDFLDELPDGEEHRTLVRALSWQKPFSNFRRALAEMPVIRQQWFAYHEQRMKEGAREWLEAQGIEAELT